MLTNEELAICADGVFALIERERKQPEYKGDFSDYSQSLFNLRRKLEKLYREARKTNP